MFLGFATDSCNGSAPHRRQNITWANDDPVHLHCAPALMCWHQRMVLVWFKLQK